MQISVRLPDELGAQLRAFAERDSRTMGQVVRLALERFLAGSSDELPIPAEIRKMVESMPQVPVSPVEAVAGVKAGPPVGVQHSSPERVDPKVCGHPKGERQVRSWGTICGLCGKRI